MPTANFQFFHRHALIEGNDMKLSFRSLLFLLTLTWLFTPLANGQDQVDFVKQIKPILEQHCFECHGADPDDYEAFLINDRDEAMAYVEVGSAEDSDLYDYTITDDEDYVMPPPDYKHQLTDAHKQLLKRWIDDGAKWPDDVEFVVFQETAAVPEVDQATQPEPTDTSSNQAAQPRPTEQSITMPIDVDDEPTDATSSDNDADDAEDKQPIDPKTQQIFNAIGSLHPAAIHLPIGLLLASGFFALLSLRGNFVMSDCAYYCLWLGAITSVFGIVTGWYFSPMENRGTVETFGDIFDQGHAVYWHRLGALIVGLFSVILALFAASARSRDPDEGVMWKLGAIVLACGVGWVGHTGGELHYPKNHYKDLNAVWQDLWANVTGADEEAEPAQDEQSSKDGTSEEGQDETSEIGTTTEG